MVILLFTSTGYLSLAIFADQGQRQRLAEAFGTAVGALPPGPDMHAAAHAPKQEARKL